jgi:cobalt-zinc-cadmium efflux system membrane fusion protein
MNVMHPPQVSPEAKRPTEGAAIRGLGHGAAAAATPSAPAPEPPPPAPRRWSVLVGLAAILAAGSYWYFSQGREVVQPTPVAAVTEPVAPGEFKLSDAEMRALRIEDLHEMDFRAERVAEGRITYNEDRSTPVFSPYNGRVVRALARLGQEVKAGEVLFEIETTDLAAAANDLLSASDGLAKARVALEQARREEARQNSLFGARAASQRDVEQARLATAQAIADQRTAEASLAAARDKMRVLGRSPAQVTRIEQTRQVDAVVPVLAPISGTVTKRQVGPGQWLSSGAADPVYVISDLSTMWLVAAVREVDAPLIKPGQPVQVTVGALPGQTFDARIATVAAGLDPTTRRMTVRAEVQDPGHLLKPEMFATFRIAVGTGQRAVAVPANALIFRGANASVWVALDGNRFMLRQIDPGIRSGDMIEVLDGLKPGERVVTGGALFVDRAARID